MLSIRPELIVVLCIGAAADRAVPAAHAFATDVVPFTEEAVARGVDYVMQNWPPLNGNSGFACTFADINSDGHQDILILGAIDGRLGVFENDGTGHFINRSFDNGVPLFMAPSGIAVADFDGDKRPDLYVSMIGVPNVLLRNIGDFQFRDVTEEAGVGDPGASKSASWGDFDGDGWLDLYVANYQGMVPGANQPNTLYRNNGDGTFTEMAAELGVADTGLGFQVVWTDMNRNGWLDLYLSNDRGHFPQHSTNLLWRNDGGTFTDISEASGAGVGLFSMGLACGDVDNNGYPDFYVTNLAGYADGYNPLLLNQGDETFIEASQDAGVDHWISSWGCIFFDFTNNGWLDLYVNNQFAANALYMNSGAFPMTDVAEDANVQATHTFGKSSYSSAVADVNGDGALDLLVNNHGGNVQLFINHEGATRRFARFRVTGEAPNVYAIGANLDVRIGDLWQFREIYAGGNGYLGQNETVIHIGAGQAKLLDEVIIRWPGNTATRTLTNYPTNYVWTVYPPSRLGDVDGNGAVDFDDFLVLAAQFNKAIVPGVEMLDFIGDCVVTEDDAIAFLDVYGGELADCNTNGMPDLLEILLDPSLDTTGNWELDACTKNVPGDLNGDGLVDDADLAALLDAWGPCPRGVTCPADIDASGAVDGVDLAVLLGNWGMSG